jgi:DNA (cytosine-5)-methyltransferase 1
LGRVRGRVNVGSLFSGAGLMDWGLTLAGFEHAWFCESDPYCRRVLAIRYPGVPIFEDVRTFEAPERVDLLAGGFPCQDVSQAGRRAGIAGERSGLWDHFARLIGELRPRYVLVENVPGLLVRGMGDVLGDLAALGYDAEWDCLPAAAFGAPHLRARIFILAYPGSGWGSEDDVRPGGHPARGSRKAMVADSHGWDAESRSGGRRELLPTPGGQRAHDKPRRPSADGRSGVMADADRQPVVRTPISRPQRHPWLVEPDVGRVAHGVPARVDRLRALGNGVVPQIAQWLGERIAEREAVRLAK